MKISKKEAELLLLAIRPLRNKIIDFCDKETKEALNSIEMKLRDNLKLNINYEKREFDRLYNCKTIKDYIKQRELNKMLEQEVEVEEDDSTRIY